MADNVPISAGTGTVIATEDISGVHYQKVKIAYGPNDSATLVSATDRFPVALEAGLATEATLAGVLGRLPSALVGGRLGVDASGTITVGTCALPSGAATEASLVGVRDRLPAALVSGKLAVDAVGTVAISGSALPTGASTEAGLVGIRDRLPAALVSGRLGVDASGTITVGTCALPTGAATDASVVAVRDRLPAALSNGNLKVEHQGSVAVTGPATDAQIRADCLNVAQSTGAIYAGTTKLTPKFAAINAAASGNNTLVAAVTGKKIKVVSLFILAAGTVNCTLQTGAGGTALTGAIPLVANTGFVLPANPWGWIETASGALLNLSLSAAIQVSGMLVYIEE